MQPTPIFLPGESHGQRSLSGYSPWAHKESDTTKFLRTQAAAAAAAAKSLQSCRTLSDPMDCSPPGSSVHGIFQARVLEWVPLAHTNKQTMPSFTHHMGSTSWETGKVNLKCYGAQKTLEDSKIYFPTFSIFDTLLCRVEKERVPWSLIFSSVCSELMLKEN